MVEEESPRLYRIGRAPDPFAPPPFDDGKNSGNRFDDPAGEFWVMYAAEQRRGCFAETLARFHPDLQLIAALKRLPDGDAGDDTPPAGVVPDDWHLKRLVGEFRVAPRQRWLDLRELEIREMVRWELAPTWVEMGLDDFDLSDALTRRRDITQAIARWAYEQGYQGIIYPSRLDNAFDCWAIFEGAHFEVIGSRSIARNDEDLAAIAQVYKLRRGS
jgi:hypothetical protein